MKMQWVKILCVLLLVTLLTVDTFAHKKQKKNKKSPAVESSEDKSKKNKRSPEAETTKDKSPKTVSNSKDSENVHPKLKPFPPNRGGKGKHDNKVPDSSHRVPVPTEEIVPELRIPHGGPLITEKIHHVHSGEVEIVKHQNESIVKSRNVINPHSAPNCSAQTSDKSGTTDHLDEIEKDVAALWSQVKAVSQPVHIHVHGGQVSSPGHRNYHSSKGGCHTDKRAEEHQRSGKDKSSEKRKRDRSHSHSHKRFNESDSENRTVNDDEKSYKTHAHGNKTAGYESHGHSPKSHHHRHHSHDHKHRSLNQSHTGHGHSHKGHDHSHKRHSHSHKGHSHSHKGHDHSHSHKGHGHSHKGHEHGHKSHSRKDHGHSNSPKGHGCCQGHQGHGHSHENPNHSHAGHGRVGEDSSHKIQNYSKGHGHGHGQRLDKDRSSSQSKGHEHRRGHHYGDSRGHSTHVHIHVTVDEKPERPHQVEEDHKQHLNKTAIRPVDEAAVYARCDLLNFHLQGHVLLRQTSLKELEVKINISGFSVRTEGRSLHGFHVHEFGDLSQGCASFGSHYNPEGTHHGGLDHNVRHVGDWGNVEANEQGGAFSYFSVNDSTLRGPHSIIGRGIVVHGLADDLGQADTASSKATGSAGARLACCIIGQTKAIPDEVWQAINQQGSVAQLPNTITPPALVPPNNKSTNPKLRPA